MFKQSIIDSKIISSQISLKRIETIEEKEVIQFNRENQSIKINFDNIKKDHRSLFTAASVLLLSRIKDTSIFNEGYPNANKI